MKKAGFGSIGIVLLVLTILSTPTGRVSGTEKPATTWPSVGLPSRIEQLILPGSELEPRPLDDRRTKVVVRVIDVFPHGSSFRYNLVYYGLEPGDYDLRDFLRRKDSGSTADLPPIPVKVLSVLPPGQIEPHRLQPSSSVFGGGYRFWMVVGGVVWFLGFLAILLIGRRNPRATELAANPGGLSLADRLQPLVGQAMAGTLGPGQHAELERMLIGYWRRRLGLDSANPAMAIAAIRSDEQAGPLLQKLEFWLHCPDHPEEVDLKALLSPYRDLPADALDGGPAIAGRVR